MHAPTTRRSTSSPPRRAASHPRSPSPGRPPGRVPTATRLPIIALAIALVALPLAGCTDAGTGDGGAGPAQASHTEALDIAPGQGVEYKVFMEEGGGLDYAWQASAPLYFDFHGEPEGAPAGEFTSHRIGDSDADQQNGFDAPFTGTHGWYWENRGDQTVTVTIHTEGTYTMVGVL